MGYGDGIASPVDMMNNLAIGGLEADVRNLERQANHNAQVANEWKTHAEKIKAELKESMASQWELAHQRDGWKKVARVLLAKYAPHLSKEEIDKFYFEMKAEVIQENPTPPSLL